MPVARRSAVRWIALAILAALCVTSAPTAAQPPAPTPLATPAPTATSVPTAAPALSPPQPTPAAAPSILVLSLGQDRAEALIDAWQQWGWPAVIGLILLSILIAAVEPWRERFKRWLDRITGGQRHDVREEVQRERQKEEDLLLAADVLAGIGAVEELTPLRNTIVTRLRALAALSDDWRTAAHPDPVLRNRAATMLDRLDADHDRPGLDLTRADYWAARIEPGVFSMGDDHGKWDDEKPQFTYRIHRPYALARFPVTNRQYLLFLEALAGSGAPAAVAAANRLKELMARHGQTIDGFRPPFWPGERYLAGEGNYPVVGVTWYAATAFAWWVDAWLRDIGVLAEGEAVRLPAEAEWERAAAYPLVLPGGDPRAGRREYPWGNDWKDTTGTANGIMASVRANTRESEINGLSVAGIFPHGAAACGAQDVAGNVWEWCSTPYLPYPFKEEVAAESLYTVSDSYVLRGGSFTHNRVVVRCAYRNDGAPGYVGGYWGFRIARVFSAGLA